MSFDPNAIGNRIFTLRTNAKLSQEKLAENLGVSHRHLGDLERGSSNGSVKILIDIAEYFHVSIQMRQQLLPNCWLTPLWLHSLKILQRTYKPLYISSGSFPIWKTAAACFMMIQFLYGLLP